MKQFIKYKRSAVAILAFVMALQGCDSFLEIDNPSAVTLEYYDTKTGQEKLLIDIYDKYRTVFNTSVLQFFGTDMYMATDESPVSAQFNGYNKDLSGLSPVIGGYWNLLYKIVQEGNIIVNRATPETAGDEYNALIAQARFFRAMAYYYLVETFGPVPLLLDENTQVSSLITKVNRDSEESVYGFMIDELNDITGKLPDRAAEAGRLSNAAVLQLLGKLYLTRSYRAYAEQDDAKRAIANFESIINMKEYKLLDKYANVFSEDNQNNEEIIWAIQYGSDKNFNGGGNPQHTQFGFNITALYPGMFALNQNDYSFMQRYIWVNPMVHEWYKYPEIDNRYDFIFKREFIVNAVENPNYGELGIFFPRWNDDSNNNKGAVYFYPFKDADGKYNWVPALPSMNWKTDAMPMSQKFKETKIDWGGKGTREDVIFRLADTYLLCAEAYLKDGQFQKALEKVNAIINRAAESTENYEVMKIDNVTDLSLDRLLEERGIELFGEHDRWFDLKRTNKLLSRARLNPLVQKYDNLSEMHRVRPIPYDEKIKLEGLNQNDGYNN